MDFLDLKDKLFCDICLDLAFLSKEQIIKALASQSVDARSNSNRPIECYLHAEGLSAHQSDLVTKLVSKAFSSANQSQTKPLPQKTFPSHEHSKSRLVGHYQEVSSGESIETGYCPICGEVGVKVLREKFRPGCLGCFFHLLLILISSGLWLIIIAVWCVIKELRPNETKFCLQCGKTLKLES